VDFEKPARRAAVSVEYASAEYEITGARAIDVVVTVVEGPVTVVVTVVDGPVTVAVVVVGLTTVSVVVGPKMVSVVVAEDTVITS
jgi:hypothetical protein